MDIQPRHWMMVGLLGFMWGGTFMVMELALRGMPPLWLAAARIGFAAALTTLIWGLRGWRLFTGPAQAWGRLAVVGVLSTALPFMLLAWGLKHVTSSYAGVSMATVPLLVLPLSFLFLPNDKIGLHQVIGLCVGFIGVIILIGPDALSSSGSTAETAARLVCFGAALCYSISSVTMRSLPPIDPIGLAAVPLIFGSSVVISAAWAIEGTPVLPDGITIFWVILLGLLPTASANLLRVMVVREAGPIFMGLTNYQVPLWSVILGALVLNEPLPGLLIFSMCLILLGVGISQGPALRALWRRLRG